MELLLKQLMDQMNTRFDRLDDEFNFLKKEVSVIKEEVVVTKKEVSVIKEEVINSSTESRSHFKHIKEKLDEQKRLFQVVEKELKKANIDIEYLSAKTGKHDTDINNINKRIQS